MSDVIIAGLISMASAIIVQVIISRADKRKQDAEDARREQKTDDQFEAIKKDINKLDDRVTEHNAYAEKFASITTDIAVIKTRIETLIGGKS